MNDYLLLASYFAVAFLSGWQASKHYAAWRRRSAFRRGETTRL